MRSAFRRAFLPFALSLTGALPMACSDDDETPSSGDGDAALGGRPGQGGDGGLGGKSESPSEPLPKEPLQLDFVRIEIPDGGEGGTDFRFVPGTDDQIVMLTRGGSMVHALLIQDKALKISQWKVPGDLYLEQACVPTNIAFDPLFEENGYVYISYCTSPQITRLTRFDWSLTEGLENPQIIVETFRDEGGAWHRFGSMGFEEDGETLWVFVGDHVFRKNGRDVSTLMGGLIRIRPSRARDKGGYTIPSGNMIDFYDPEGMGGAQSGPTKEPTPELYAYGLRSPFRATRDSFGRFWVGDIGDALYEEVNLITQVGQNFGWSTYEGPCDGDDCERFVDSLTGYGRGDHRYATEDPATNPSTQRSVWVGEIYESPSQDRYDGKMNGVVPFGDIFTGWVRGLLVSDDGKLEMDKSIGHLETLISWRVGPDGYAYALTLDGDLHRAVLRESTK